MTPSLEKETLNTVHIHLKLKNTIKQKRSKHPGNEHVTSKQPLETVGIHLTMKTRLETQSLEALYIHLNMGKPPQQKALETLDSHLNMKTALQQHSLESRHAREHENATSTTIIWNIRHSPEYEHLLETKPIGNIRHPPGHENDTWTTIIWNMMHPPEDNIKNNILGQTEHWKHDTSTWHEKPRCIPKQTQFETLDVHLKWTSYLTKHHCKHLRPCRRDTLAYTSVHTLVGDDDHATGPQQIRNIIKIHNTNH